MARVAALGLVECPECGYKEAEIRLTKTGKAYRFCPDCNAQFFTRNEDMSSRLLAKIQAVKLENTPKIETPKPVHEDKKPEKKGFDLGSL